MIIAELRQIAEFAQGGRHGLSGKDLVRKGFPAYGAGGVNGFLPEAEFERDAIVLSSIGARCGKCFLAKGQWSSLANTQLIFPDPNKADVHFLWYQLNDETRWPRHGLAQPFIRPSDVKAHRVFLPSLSEQRRIAAILDKADALRRKRKRALELLDGLGQSIFLEMFGDPVQNSKGWVKTTVGEALRSGHIQEIQDGNHGERHPKVSDFVSEGIPFITANCLRSGSLEIEDAYKLDPIWLSRLRVGFGRGGDLLLSHKGTVGEVAIIPTSVGRVILSPQVTYYRTGPELDAQFLSGVFRAKSFQSLLANAAEQSTRAYIGLTKQRELPIILPPVSIQRKFASLASRTSGLLMQQKAIIESDSALFSSIQSRAFSGHL